MEAIAINGSATKVLIWRAALLRKLYPDGIPVMKFEEALTKLEIAEQISQSVVATDIEQKARAPRPAPTPEEAPAPEASEESAEESEPSGLSAGAERLIELVKSKPGITMTAITKQLEYSQSYVYQLVGEARRAGFALMPIKRGRAKGSFQYKIIATPMRESTDKQEAVTQ